MVFPTLLPPTPPPLLRLQDSVLGFMPANTGLPCLWSLPCVLADDAREGVCACVGVRARACVFVCVCAHVCSSLAFSLPNLIPPPPMPSSLSLIPVAIISCYSGPYLRTGSSVWGVWGWGCGWCSLRVLAWGPHPELPLPTHFEGFRQLLRAEQAGGWGLFPFPHGRRRSLSYPLLVLTVLCLKPVWESLLKPTSGALRPLHCLSLVKPWAAELKRQLSLMHVCIRHVCTCVYMCLCACVDTSVCVCVIAVPSQMRTSFCLMHWFWF